MKSIKQSLLLCLIGALLLSLSLPAAAAATGASLKDIVKKSADYMLSTVAEPQCADIGGEWAVLGLARSESAVPGGCFEGYYASVESRVKACEGVLHAKKYTEYSRVIIALTAIGKDPANVGGYDLLTPLGDFDKTVWQGLNGPIWALIALDSGNYPMPENAAAETQATRQMYVDRILDRQLSDGGWCLSSGDNASADPDMTAMALQALAKYTDQERVSAAVEKALPCLSKLQNDEGGYTSWGTANSESCAQVIVALCELGIPLDDPRFVKNGTGLLDNLLTFARDDGSFRHTADGEANQMATEQCFYAITAAMRAAEGKSSLYRMAEAAPLFSDLSAHPDREAIEALAARKMISGMGDGTFAPDKTMTRAEFCTIVVKALALTPAATDDLRDVARGAWYAPFVGAAYGAGIISGMGDGTFNPGGIITRQEAASMLKRAAAYCVAPLADCDAEGILSGYSDGNTVAVWARGAMSACLAAGLLDADGESSAAPLRPVLRCEVARSVYRLLQNAGTM